MEKTQNNQLKQCLTSIDTQSINLELLLIEQSKIKYLYISVPLFSLTSIIENSFQKVYPRHLSGGHTHLYTKDSIYYLAKKYKFSIIGEWWFGLDIADLFRSIIISSSQVDRDVYNTTLRKYFYSILDDLQKKIDEKKLCSEVHLILSK